MEPGELTANQRFVNEVFSPIVVEQPKANPDERPHKVETQQMPLNQLFTSSPQDWSTFEQDELVERSRLSKRYSRPDGQVQGIVEGDRERDDEGLSHLESVDAGQDVDPVGRECR
jgi:hypothetical protein